MGGNEATALAHANAMPAPTWHFLDMNDATIEIPQHLAVTPAVSTSVSQGALAEPDDFAASFAMLQSWWEVSHPPISEEERAVLEASRAAEAGATYGGTARSRYQANADAVEEKRSLAAAFRTGVGEATATLLRRAAGDAVVVAALENQRARARITVMGVDGAMSAAAIDVIAGMNSVIDLDIVVDSPDADGASGFTGTTVRVLAGFGAKVNIRRMQTLDGGFSDIDDIGVLAVNDASIQVQQTVLGGARTYTGLAADLRGDRSRIGIDVHYLGHGEQRHDFNYAVNHHGRDTESDIQANGVLAGRSMKTLRGTIDLIRGCKGAKGNERESVLLVDKGVRNRTVPVILCNEDDVMGNHGATIGHVNAEQLHYLQSRGLSEAEVEALFLEASFEQAAINAPSEQSAAGVERLARAVLGHGILLDDDTE